MENNMDHVSSLPGPDSISRFELENGIVLLTYQNRAASSIYAVGLMPTGSINDPLDKSGLANFTAAILTRGTKTRDFATYHRTLEEHGANLSFSSGTRHTWFRGRSLVEDADILMALAADSLINPAIDPIYVERLRKQLLAGLAIREQDAGDQASMRFDQLLFPGHPYGNPVDGSVETVSAISREDIQTFRDQNYGPKGLIIAVAGNIDPKQIHTIVSGNFSAWENHGDNHHEVPSLPPGPDHIVREHIALEEKSQTDLILGTRGPGRTSADYLPAFLGNNILGQFGLMGRIGESVRSRSGLAYYASSSINSWSDCGTWEVSAGTNPDNVDKTIQLIRDEIKRFIESPVTDEELDDSRSHLVGRLPLSLESNAGLANAILSMEQFNLGLDYFQRYRERMEQINAEQLMKTARKYLHPDKLVIASAGAGGAEGS